MTCIASGVKIRDELRLSDETSIIVSMGLVNISCITDFNVKSI